MSGSGGMYGVWETCGSARIVTAAAAGGICVRGTVCSYIIQDLSGGGEDIAIPTAEGLRELLAVLRPAQIEFVCTEAERTVLRTLAGAH